MTTPGQYRRLTKKSKSSDKAIRNNVFYSRKSFDIQHDFHAQIQKIMSEGIQLNFDFFKLMKGVIIGPRAKRHLNGVSLASG